MADPILFEFEVHTDEDGNGERELNQIAFAAVDKVRHAEDNSKGEVAFSPGHDAQSFWVKVEGAETDTDIPLVFEVLPNV